MSKSFFLYDGLLLLVSGTGCLVLWLLGRRPDGWLNKAIAADAPNPRNLTVEQREANRQKLGTILFVLSVIGLSAGLITLAIASL